MNNYSQQHMFVGNTNWADSTRAKLSSCWIPLVSFCNTIGVVGLGFCVCFLFAQLQYVHYKLGQEEKQIKSLRAQVDEQQAGQIEQLSEQVEHQHDYTIYQIALVFSLLTCLVTLFHMVGHLRSMYEPLVQRKIVAILWMSPIYSITSFFSLILPKAEGYLSILKDFYEAYVVYTFLAFLIAVLGKGDRDAVVNVLARHSDHLENPTRCLRRFYNPPPETSPEAKASAVLLECQMMAMQFVLVRPLTSLASFLVFTITNDQDHDGVAEDEVSKAAVSSYFLSPNFFIAMVENVSVFFAFTGLLKFYHVVRDDLAWLQPFSKFLAIKGIVFLTFWQGLAISIIVSLDGNKNDNKNDHDQAMAIQNLLICVEMLIFSLAHWCVFPYEEWEPGYRPKQMARPGLGIRDFAKDVRAVMGSRSTQGAVRIPQNPGEDGVHIEMNSGIVTAETGNGGDDDSEEDKII